MSEQNPNVENQSIYEEPAAQVLGSDAAVEIPAEVQDVPAAEPVAAEPAAAEPAAADPAPAAESAGAAAAAAAGAATGAQYANPYGNAQGAQQFGQPGPQQWSQPAGQQQPWQQPAQQYQTYQQYQQPQGNPYGNAQYGWQQTSPAVTKGPLERAWNDFMADPQKLKKTGLLTLVNCVPILNFVFAGYTLKWTESAARQQDAAMPEKIITGENFKFGFFQFLIALVVGVVLGLIACVPMVGWIVCLFGVPFVFLASVRMFLYRELGAAFALSALWEKFKNDVGGTMFISWIPSLIGGAVISLVAIVCMMIGGVSFAGVAIAVHSHDAALGAGAGAFAITLVLAIIVICALVSTIVNLIAFRAFGYWAVDHAPDWIAGVKPVNPQAPQAGNPYGTQPPYGQQNPYQQAQQYGQPYQQPMQQPQQWQPQPQAQVQVQPQQWQQPQVQQQPQQGSDPNQQ